MGVELMDYFIYFIFIIFAVFGLSEFLHMLKLFIIFPKAKIKSQLIIKLKNETAEKDVVYICEQFCWYGKKFADTLIFNCEELTCDIYERCKKITEKYGLII